MRKTKVEMKLPWFYEKIEFNCRIILRNEKH